MKEEKTSGAGRSHFAGEKTIEQEGKGNLVHNLFGQTKSMFFSKICYNNISSRKRNLVIETWK